MHVIDTTIGDKDGILGFNCLAHTIHIISVQINEEIMFP